jgi:hypothetical protein
VPALIQTSVKAIEKAYYQVYEEDLKGWFTHSVIAPH